MPKIYQFKTNFVAGELDPLMIGRPDIKHYHNAARLMRNAVSIPQGGFTSRGGTVFKYKIENDPELSGVSNVRAAPFQYTTDEAYMVVFVHKKAIIFYQGAVVATVAMPYTSNDLISHFRQPTGDMISAGINWTQSLDQMIIYHENYQPRVLKRGNSHSVWTVSPMEFDNIPRVDFGAVYTNGIDEVQTIRFPDEPDSGAQWIAGDTYALIVEDEETETIPNGGWGQNAGLTASQMQSALRNLPNLSSTGITVVASDPSAQQRHATFTVTFSGKDGKRPWGTIGYKIVGSTQSPALSISIKTRGERPGEDAISDGRGWPRCGVFFQGRHWMAGSRSLPNTVWATRSGTDNDLNNKRVTDDYGFQYSADTDDVPAFLNIYPGRHLQLFSTAGEFYIPVSENEGVTPKNMVIRRTSSRGSKPGLRVVEVDGATVFVQSRGKALREFIFADSEAAYQANSISLLSSHLMKDPLSLSMRRSTSTDSADLMFMPNPEGDMTVFCTLRTQEVNAMSLWTTKGKYREVCPVYDEVYIITEREIDGVTSLYVELYNSEISTDCAVISLGQHSGLSVPHLLSETVDIVLDSSVQQQASVDGSGNVVFDRESENIAIVGMPWPEIDPVKYPGYRWLVETLPPEIEMNDGTIFGRKRRIVEVAVRLHNTTGIVINGSRISFRYYGDDLLDKPIRPFTGIKTLKALLGWSYEGAVFFGETQPTRATVLGVSWAVSV